MVEASNNTPESRGSSGSAPDERDNEPSKLKSPEPLPAESTTSPVPRDSSPSPRPPQPAPLPRGQQSSPATEPVANEPLGVELRDAGVDAMDIARRASPRNSIAEDNGASGPDRQAAGEHVPALPDADATGAIVPLPQGGPACMITLLLTSGSRHPYRIDEKYLAKRNVSVPDITESGQPDPFSISVYTLKELILREWREEWEGKPSSPSSIRLIHFGKLLDDKDQLKQYQFSTETPNIVHMTVRPQDVIDEEEPKSGSKANAARPRQSAHCCCVIL